MTIKDLWRRLRNLAVPQPLESSEMTEQERQERREFEKEIEQLRNAYHDQANQLNTLLVRTEYERRRQYLDDELRRRHEADND